MQIAILHYSVPPVIGGVEVTIAAHARLLRAHGYNVTLIAGRGDNAVTIPEMDSRHPRVEAVQRELHRGNVTPEFFTLTQDLTRALRHALHACVLCIAHNLVTLHKNLALTTALHQLVRTDHLKLLAWCHDFAWNDPVYADDLHDGAPWDLLRTVWDNTRYVVVSASRRTELARLLRLDPSAITVVPPGIDPAEFFRVTETTASWIHNFRLLDSAPLLLLPARVTRRKNIELAIDIVNALRGNGYAPRLVVMGPLGPHNPANRAYLDELKTRAGDDILFLQEHGAVGDAERRDLYALADALLFPSAREGFGIPILEAGLARLPIFCADIPPFRESARQFAHYFALDLPPAHIAARMAEFFTGDALYQLKRRVVTEYTWESLFREHIAPLLNPP